MLCVYTLTRYRETFIHLADSRFCQAANGSIAPNATLSKSLTHSRNPPTWYALSTVSAYGRQIGGTTANKG